MKPLFYFLSKQLRLQLLLILFFPFFSHSQGFSPETMGRLQHVIDSFQSNPSNPYVGGISAAIKVDDLAFWQGATGYAARNVDGNNNLLPGGTAFTTSTLSRMYSVTKTFTASLVLELAQEGSFSLEDKVSTYIPFLNTINAELNGNVTIRQLLAHESGYSDYTDEFMLQLAVAFQPTHTWTAFELLSFVHQVSAPGSVRKYCSTNYIVLGAIVELVTNKPLEQHFRERFFTPLHLNSMYFDIREQQWPGSLLASPHDNISPFNPIFQLTGQPTFPNAYTNISVFPFTAISSLEFSSGGLITNVADMAEWGNSLFGGRATSQSTINEMINSISSTPDNDGDFLGYGIFRTTKISTNDVFIGHDGSAPGYRSVMFYQPERKMTIAILTNYHGARLYDVAKALFGALPDFICGNKNKKEDKIIISFNGNNVCVDRKAAKKLIERGGYLGSDQSSSATKTLVNQTGVQENLPDEKNSILSLYPNPASEILTISFSPESTGQAEVTIYDMNKRLISVVHKGIIQKGSSQKIQIETEKFSPGMYLVQLKTAKAVFEKKFVISR